MKVAAVFRVSLPHEGGGHTFGESLLRALEELGPESRHEFVYYVSVRHGGAQLGLHFTPGTRREHYRRRGIEIIRSVRRKTGRPQPGPRTQFERSLEEQQVDVVWFVTNFAEQECDLPFVLTIYDIEHVRQPWFPEVSSGGEWESRHGHYSYYVPRATRVIVPNAAGLEQVVHHFRVRPESVLCLPHPTPTFAREAAEREPLPRARIEGLGIRGQYLFYPAQFWAHKNHATLLDSLALLANEGGEPYELVLVGSDQGQLAHVRDLARDVGVTELVHFLGFVGVEDLVALYQHAHALTYVSFFGPENLPPLEAFALGCPVVAADIPGAREQLGSAALLAPPTDPVRIAEAVRRLEEPELRSELTQLGRARAEALTPEAYVRGVLEFLDEFERTRRCWE